MMPMFRVRLSGVSLGISFQLTAFSNQLAPKIELTNRKSTRPKLTADR
jgi:hypothetical protein